MENRKHVAAPVAEKFAALDAWTAEFLLGYALGHQARKAAAEKKDEEEKSA